MSLVAHTPAPPNWTVDWRGLRDQYACLDELHSCAQEPAYHSEGDVGIHTSMACEELAASQAFRELPPQDRQTVFAALVLHDVGKPATTRLENERLTSRGHSRSGEILARTLLWREGVPFEQREAICGMIRHHQDPFFLVTRPDSQRRAFAISQLVRCDHLALVAWADARGRECADPEHRQRALDNIALFREYCAELQCLTAPRKFPSAYSRFLYFTKEGRDPNYSAHDDSVCEVTLMSGLPAAGKDHWIHTHGGGLPVVSLDELRSQLGVDPASPQRRVVDAGRTRAKQLLRVHQSFIWNATNISEQVRESLIGLFTGYRARVRIVYVEAPEPIVRQRNAERPAPVPRNALQGLLRRWTVPAPSSAHSVVYEIHRIGMDKLTTAHQR